MIINNLESASDNIILETEKMIFCSICGKETKHRVIKKEEPNSTGYKEICTCLNKVKNKKEDKECGNRFERHM